MRKLIFGNFVVNFVTFLASQFFLICKRQRKILV